MEDVEEDTADDSILSFLDVLTCGLGGAILLFLVFSVVRGLDEVQPLRLGNPIILEIADTSGSWTNWGWIGVGFASVPSGGDCPRAAEAAFDVCDMKALPEITYADRQDDQYGTTMRILGLPGAQNVSCEGNRGISDPCGGLDASQCQGRAIIYVQGAGTDRNWCVYLTPDVSGGNRLMDVSVIQGNQEAQLCILDPFGVPVGTCIRENSDEALNAIHPVGHDRTMVIGPLSPP